MKFSAHSDGVHNTVFSCDDARGMGPGLGYTTHGFPYLSGVGRLIIKDTIIVGAAVVTLADSARTYQRRNEHIRG
jgi:uncharacterized membrane protein YkgB